MADATATNTVDTTAPAVNPTAPLTAVGATQQPPLSSQTSAPIAPVMTPPLFGTEEVLWYNNGRWGSAGYALPNPGGKTWTTNALIYQFHLTVGRNMFELMHREDVKFYRPAQKQWFYDLHQLIIVGRKWLSDNTRAPNDSAGLTIQHAAPNAQVFLCYPVPFFGERVRNQDARQYCQWMLLMLSEMMQHSDNDIAEYITPQFASTVGKYLQEVLARMAMKYFGYTRAQAYDPAFSLKDADFTTYNPAAVLTSVEMTESRPPVQWWPTSSDLDDIRGRPINELLLFAQRWPQSALLAQANGNVLVSPVVPAAVPTSPAGLSSAAFPPTPGAAP